MISIFDYESNHISLHYKNIKLNSQIIILAKDCKILNLDTSVGLINKSRKSEYIMHLRMN